MNKGNIVLPPSVSGKLFGHLTMKVNEILWCEKYSGNVSVEFKWWGDENVVTFRPCNILEVCHRQKEDTTKIFDIKTNLSLFELYLRNCLQLELFVRNSDTNEFIGKAYIKCLYQITTDFQYQGYFPIINSFGNRIGDIYVGFLLWMKRAVSREQETNNSRPTVAAKKDNELKKKKGCNLCIRDKPNSKEYVPSFEMTVPPNTERSELSDEIISDILSKGQQLRNAMVMSILTDSDELPEKDVGCVRSNRANSHKSYQSSSINEREQIVDYLLGKQMSEEEETKALETLRTTSPANSLLELVELHSNISNEDVQDTQDSASVTDEKETPTWRSARETARTNHSSETQSSLPPEFKNLNCFRITLKNLSLTPLGMKRINIPNKKSRYKPLVIKTVQPGSKFFIECHMDHQVVSQSQTWKLKSERFCARRQIDNVIYFGQSNVYQTPTPFTISGLNSVLNCMTWLVCYKHFDQQKPSLLGNVNFVDRTPVESLETLWKLPVDSADGTYGIVEIFLELGRDKKYFGNLLLEKENKSIKEKQIEKTTDHNNYVKTKYENETLGPISKDQENYSAPEMEQRTISDKLTNNRTCINERCHPVKHLTSEVGCTNCALCGSQIRNVESVLCVGCQSTLISAKTPTPRQVSTVTHEFLVKIESVEKSPLFSNREDVKCYVDYNFIDADVFGKGFKSRETVTSRVKNYSNYVIFGSEHVHKLYLPITTTLSSCISSYMSDIRFQVWLRYFKPSPRDHMVAVANLPVDQLKALEKELNSNYSTRQITKSFHLPLVLVPSSVTTKFQQHCHTKDFGTLHILLSYRNCLPSEFKKFEVAEKEQESITSFNDNQSEKITWETYSEEKENRACNSRFHVQQQKTADLYNTFVKDNVTQTEFKQIETPVESRDIDESVLNIMRQRFWTGLITNEREHDTIDKTVLKPSDMNKTEFPINSIDDEKTAIHNNVQISRAEVDEFTDSGIYSSSMKGKFSQQTKFISSEELVNESNGRDPNLRDEDAVNKVLSSRSLKSDHSLSVIEECSLTSELKSLQGMEYFEREFVDVNAEKVVVEHVPEKSDSERLSDVQSFDNYNVNTTPKISLVEKIRERECVVHEEQTIEGIIENYEVDEDNLLANNVDHDFNIKITNMFRAKVTIEQAMHLPKIIQAVAGEVKSRAPSICVSFKNGCPGNYKIVTTDIVKESCNPVWNASWDVELSRDMLEQVDKRMVFSLYEERVESDSLFGQASADLTVLCLGLSYFSGWLNIHDFGLTCKGQLKVTITPLEDISQSKPKLLTNLAARDINKTKTENDCVYIARGQFQTFPTFVASQTEIFVTRVTNDAANDFHCSAGSSPDVFQVKIAEMEAFISSMKTKKLSKKKQNETQVDKGVQSEEIILVKDSKENNKSVKTVEESKTSKEQQSLSVDTLQHNTTNVDYLSAPFMLQRFLSHLSEIPSNAASDGSDIEKSYSTVHSDNINVILDQNISEFERFLQNKRIDLRNKVNYDDSSNATRASEIVTDQSYNQIRETPEGGNPVVEAKNRKLERQRTYVVDDQSFVKN